MLLHTSSAILQNEQTITNLHLRVKEKTIQLQNNASYYNRLVSPKGWLSGQGQWLQLNC